MRELTIWCQAATVPGYEPLPALADDAIVAKQDFGGIISIIRGANL